MGRGLSGGVRLRMAELAAADRTILRVFILH
jgi:hypothetical protein